MSAKKKPEPAAPAAQEPQQEEKGADPTADSQPSAKPALAASVTAPRFTTGSVPGIPEHLGHTLSFGAPPNSFAQPQNTFECVSISAWISSPITGTYLI